MKNNRTEQHWSGVAREQPRAYTFAKRRYCNHETPCKQSTYTNAQQPLAANTVDGLNARTQPAGSAKMAQ